MNKFKSLKTYEKLQNITTEEPVLALGEKDEIEQTLQDFRINFRQATFPEAQQKDQSAIKINDKPTVLGSNAQPNLEENMSGFLDNKFKAQLQRNMNKENAVVKMFGNALIATVFQSLVLRTVESLFKISVNLETDIPISSQVLKVFNISSIALSSFKSTDEKVNYILSCMDKSIEQIFSAFKDRQDFKDKKLDEQDKAEAKKQSKFDKNDHFPWLRVKTQYESLRKRLNTAIIEKLNDYENLVGVLEKLKEKQELKKKGQDSKSSKLKYFLKNTTQTTTKDIFQNMSKFGNPRVQQYLSRLGVTTETEQLSTSTFFNGPDDSNKSQQEVNKIKSFWTEQKEALFKNNRQSKKQIYSSEVTSSSWNEVGFLPFVQKYFLEMKKSMQRDHLLDRYADGEWLTAEELKLLSNTSELLNSCIDRKFMQSAVDIIDKDVILNLELGLAEDILKNYEEIQIDIKRSRQDFIKASLAKAQSKLKEYEERKSKERQRVSHEIYHLKKKKMLTSICYKMEREEKFKDSPPEDVQGSVSLQKFIEGKIDQDYLLKELKDIRYYADQLDSTIQAKNIEQENLKQKKAIKEEKKQYYNSMSLPTHSQDNRFFSSLARHSFHPPSKLFIADERSIGEYTEEEQEKFSEMSNAVQIANKKDQQSFKIELKSNIALKNPHHFKKFFSGGPPKPSRVIPFYDPFGPGDGTSKATQYELRCIIMIQKKFRKHKEEKRMRAMLDNIEKEKYYDYKNKIDQIRHLQKQQFKIVIGETIKDMQILTGDDLDKHTATTQTQPINTPAAANISGKTQLYHLGKQSNKSFSKHQLSVNNNLSTSYLNTTAASLGNNNPSQMSKRTHAGQKVRELLSDSSKKQDLNTSETHSHSNSKLSTTTTVHRPKTSHFKQIMSNSLSNFNTSLNQSQYFYTGSPHYTSIFLSPKQDLSEFKRSKDQLSSTPIEKQLKNIKLIESAINNQFWAINTGNFVFSKRDIYLTRDRQGWSALHWATFHKNEEYIQWLLNQGGDPNAADNQGNTPTHIAFKTDKLDTALAIIHGGGNLNAINMKGETPLGCGSEQLLKKLNLSEGVRISNPEVAFDNNKFLPFITSDEMSNYKVQSYSMRFLSRKFQRDPSLRLRQSLKVGGEANKTLQKVDSQISNKQE